MNQSITKDNIKAIVAEYQNELLNNLKEIVAIESLRDKENATDNAPFGPNCRKALDWFLNRAHQDGFVTKDVDGYAGVAYLGDSQETFSMLGHLDVVPADAAEWDTPPFEMQLKDGILIGRGVLDDKGPAMAAYMAMKIIKDYNIPLKKKIMLICGVDEESGMECMDYFVKHHALPDQGIVPDADFPVIYGEKGILHFNINWQADSVIKELRCGMRPNIVIGKASGIVNGDLKEKEFKAYLAYNQLTGECTMTKDGAQYTIYGKNFHGSMPQKGINAGLHWCNFVGVNYQDKVALEIYRLGQNPFGAGMNIAYDGLYMGPLTLNVGIINIDSKQAMITCDIRYPNDVDGADLIATIQKSTSGTLSDISDAKPLFVDPQSELVTSCMEVYRDVTKDSFSPPKTMGGGTYARKLPNHVAFGPEIIGKEARWYGGPHEKNEGFALENLLLATEIYVLLLLKVCKA